MAGNETEATKPNPAASKDDDSRDKPEEKLPPLSAKDFKVYNSIAENMDQFHNHFRSTWTLLWTACTANKRRPRGMTPKQLIDTGLTFVRQLSMHHSIEERHVFPHLGARMPEFRGDLQDQHARIHEGLDRFEEYLRSCRSGDAEFELPVLRGHMEGWGDVLWTHLDDEVRALGAENMRRYWSVGEVKRMPMYRAM